LYLNQHNLSDIEMGVHGWGKHLNIERKEIIDLDLIETHYFVLLNQ